MDLIVKLVTTPSASLTVTPDDDGISPGSNGITLVWKRDTTGAPFHFSATSLSGLPNPPFSAPSYDPNSNTITIVDSYTGPTHRGDFAYSLSVTSGMTTYSAAGNPKIINR